MAGIYSSYPAISGDPTGSETVAIDSNKSRGAGPQTETITLTGLATWIASTLSGFVKTSVASVFTAQQNFGTATLTDGATINWNVATAQVAKVTLGGSRTMAAPTNLVDGGTYVLRVIQDATGSRTITWNAVFKWSGGTPPTLTATANGIDVISFTSDGTNLFGVAQTGFA